VNHRLICLRQRHYYLKVAPVAEVGGARTEISARDKVRPRQIWKGRRVWAAIMARDMGICIVPAPAKGVPLPHRRIALVLWLNGAAR
jgi:hypothetical protein